MRGADILIATLAEAGVDRIFSLSGNQIMPVYDACIDARIEIIHTRHEASAVFMADAYAQLTGKIGVALVTAAPGFANALSPLFTAMGSESPVLLLSGDAPVGKDGRGAFQELDQVAASKPLTKHSARVMSAGDMAAETAKAIRIARSSRPGPVHLALPFDVVQDKVTDASGGQNQSFEPANKTPEAGDVTAIAGLIANASNPIVVCGPAMNATRTKDTLAQLSDAIAAPVLAMESPRGLNDPALGRFAQALQKADLIVSLGKRIDFTLGFGAAEKFAANARWIIVDADGDALERAALNVGERIEKTVECCPEAMAAALIQSAKPSNDRAAWREKVDTLVNARSYEDKRGATSNTITPLTLCAAVQRQMDKAVHSVLLCDGGEFGQWSQAELKGDERVINGPAGAIGGVLCYALGARVARPDAAIFALMGDGTVGFQFSEFETAVREKLPFVIVIGNDECWNAEHQIQLRDYGPDRLIGCQLSGARYDLAVKGLGGHGEYVNSPDELDAALDRAVASGLPACVNVSMEGWPAPKA